MLINGKIQVDVQDLKNNTVYTGFKETDQVIKWFWEFVEGLDQERLSHLIHFVTGNGRVPIFGFKYL